MLDDILLQVNKPGRYIAGEWNAAKKNFDEAEIKFALCFPDLYEVGMSNLGVRIIYSILNNLDYVNCERFFSVDCDMENVLRRNRIEIFSLESKKRLKEFDIIGFSLAYELNYTNVLNILDLGTIPLKSSLRDNSYPLVIGGGPCTLNPEPMHEFFDLFVIGEAEEVILEIVDTFRKLKHKFKAGKISKQDLLSMLSKIEGVYVPSFYEVTYNGEGKIEEFKPRIKGSPCRIKKRFIKDLDSAHFPLDWLIPYIQIVHDRISLEIMRGCPNRCRFCQARSQYFPFRQRKIKNVLDLASALYKRTGYEEISLAGLSVSDYPGIEELLAHLIRLFKEKGVSVSLPSIKPKAVVAGLSALIATIKKTGFTFAPEAATERLRNILAKDFDMEDFYKSIEQAYRHGWQHIKLYFMIGLPSEEQEDLDAILDFASQVSELKKEINPSASSCRRGVGQTAARVNISINTFIPKPHTPFQWLKMEDLDSIKHKQNYLKRKMRNKKLILSLHNPCLSFLEGVFSRGDRRLSQVILSAFNRGARFDAWENYFRFDAWQEGFLESNLNPDFYLKERALVEYLPWDFLDVGVSKETLVGELKKAIAI